MKYASIVGLLAVTILMTGCGEKTPDSSSTPSPAAEADLKATPIVAVPAESTDPEEPALVTKARGIVLPEFKVDGVTLTDALLQLRNASQQNDPKKEGINFMLTQPNVAEAIPKITLDLKNVTVADVAQQIAKAAGVGLSPRDYAIVFEPK